MGEKTVNMSIRLDEEQSIFWRLLREKIGSTTDVGVFFFIFSQFRDFVGDEIELFDFKKIRDVWDEFDNYKGNLDLILQRFVKLEDLLKLNQGEIKKLKERK